MRLLHGAGTLMALATIVVLLPAERVWSLTEWINPQTGVSAGDWFVPANWNPATVPTSGIVAINNGGEAHADVATAPGAIVVTQVDVGKNGGSGQLTVDGVDLLLAGSLDFGDVELGFATGSSIVTSQGTGVLRDALNVTVGTPLVGGDLDIGQTLAADTAQATGTGSLTIERVTLLDVAGDLDLGETGGTAQATGDGTLVAADVDTINVGGSFEIGETGSTSGVKLAHGAAQIDRIGQLNVAGSVNVSRTVGAGGQDTGSGSLTVRDAGTIGVGSRLNVGHTGVNSGGIAASDGTLTIERATSLNVASVFGVGHVRNTSGSGQATTTGSATLADVDDVLIGGDLFVGRNFSDGDVQGTANGTLTIDRANTIDIGADLDVGQTATTGSGSAGSATGTGFAALRDVTGQIRVAQDVDVGRTNAVAGSTAQGNGTLVVERAGSFEVAGHLDIGKTTSRLGQETGTGNVTIADVATVSVGADLDVGQTRGSSATVNRGDGTLSITRATVAVGFANVVDPGSLDIAKIIANPGEQADARGSVTLDQVRLQVASRAVVGELRGGSADPANTADATLAMVDSLVTMARLDVATIADGTAGSVAGRVQLDASLINVASLTTFGAGGTLAMAVGGTTRADGSGGPGQYSAVDTVGTALDGRLELSLSGGFEPLIHQTFTLVSATGGVSGTFASISRPSAGGIGLAVQYNPFDVTVIAVLLGDMDRDDDVDFDDIDDFVLGLTTPGDYESKFGVPSPTHGDFDGDNDQDFDDIAGLVAALGAGDRAALQSVPEPATLWLAGAGLLALAVASSRFARTLLPRSLSC